MTIETRQLRALVAVADEGTFTDAAIALCCSQPTVSRTIVALEVAVGARLVERSTQHVTLTAAGEQVLALARRTLGLLDAIAQVGQDATVELRVGYAWSALGRHTVGVQRSWGASHPHAPLVFVQTDSPTGGLVEGVADVAVLRRPVVRPGLATAVVGTEARMAAVAVTDPLAAQPEVTLADLAGRTIGVDARTGTTSERLWPAGSVPRTRPVHGVDAWLTSIAAGQTIGMTSTATAHQHPRSEVAYRPVRDAPPIDVTLAWWADNPPRDIDALAELVTRSYRGPSAG